MHKYYRLMGLCTAVMSAANPAQPDFSVKLTQADVEREGEAYHGAVMNKADEFEAIAAKLTAYFDETSRALSNFLQGVLKNSEDNNDYATYIGYVATARRIFLHVDETFPPTHETVLDITRVHSDWLTVMFDYLELIKQYMYSAGLCIDGQPYKRRDITAAIEKIRTNKGEAGGVLHQLYAFCGTDLDEIAGILNTARFNSTQLEDARSFIALHYERLEKYMTMFGRAVPLSLSLSTFFYDMVDVGNAILIHISAAEKFIDEIKAPDANRLTDEDGDLNPKLFTDEKGEVDYEWFKARYEACGEWVCRLKDKDLTAVRKVVANMRGKFGQCQREMQKHNDDMNSFKSTQLDPFMGAMECAGKSIMNPSEEFLRLKIAAKRAVNKAPQNRQYK
ncbi:hypothetical protein PAPHI01_0770 [Pancytospora philotis]|nr:hypothetical protein PAPHI01_0770 [Pancytospora philotis]